METSVFNVATSDQNRENRKKTLKLIAAIQKGNYEGYTSNIAIQEIMKSPSERVEELMRVIKNCEVEILPDAPEVDGLAQEYIKAGLIPAKHLNDALHIAVATCHEMDAVVTWNFEHMIKLKTRKGIPSVNVLVGYKPIEIISPLEVIEDDES